MANTSNTNSQTQLNIQHRIDIVFDINPKIKIRKLQHGTIQVNDMLIANDNRGWHVGDEYFFRRKSAVGYALCLVKNKIKLARQIKYLDAQLQKIKLDLDVYHKNIKTVTSTIKREVLSHRISNDMPYLIYTDNQLTSLLKTVSV